MPSSLKSERKVSCHRSSVIEIIMRHALAFLCLFISASAVQSADRNRMDAIRLDNLEYIFLAQIKFPQSMGLKDMTITGICHVEQATCAKGCRTIRIPFSDLMTKPYRIKYCDVEFANDQACSLKYVIGDMENYRYDLHAECFGPEKDAKPWDRIIRGMNRSD